MQFAVNAMLNLSINVILSTLFLHGHPVQSILNWKYEDPENLNVNIIKQSTKRFLKKSTFQDKTTKFVYFMSNQVKKLVKGHF